MLFRSRRELDRLLREHWLAQGVDVTDETRRKEGWHNQSRAEETPLKERSYTPAQGVRLLRTVRQDGVTHVALERHSGYVLLCRPDGIPGETGVFGWADPSAFVRSRVPCARCAEAVAAELPTVRKPLSARQL